MLRQPSAPFSRDGQFHGNDDRLIGGGSRRNLPPRKKKKIVLGLGNFNNAQRELRPLGKQVVDAACADPIVTALNRYEQRANTVAASGLNN